MNGEEGGSVPIFKVEQYCSNRVDCLHSERSMPETFRKSRYIVYIDLLLAKQCSNTVAY